MTLVATVFLPRLADVNGMLEFQSRQIGFLNGFAVGKFVA
jgi:hypothetical protein